MLGGAAGYHAKMGHYVIELVGPMRCLLVNISLTIIRGERSFGASQLALPPVVRTFRLLDHPDSVTFSKYQISHALPIKVI